MSLLLPFNISKWQPWLERVQAAESRDPFPIDKALKWIQLESGGNACAVGKVANGHVYEAGLAQTYFDTPSTVKYGVTSAQLRGKCSGTSMPTNLTDDDRIMHARVALATFKEHRDYARKKLLLNGASLPEKGADFWCFVKMGHALPGLFSYLPAAKRSLGHFPTWRQFTNYVDSLSPESLTAIDHGTAPYAFEDSDGNSPPYPRYASSTASTPDGKYIGWRRFWKNCESFAGYSGGFVDLEMLAVLAIIAALAVALSRFGVL